MRGQDIIIWVLLYFWGTNIRGRLDYLINSTNLSKREIQNSFIRLEQSKLFDSRTGLVNPKIFTHFYNEAIRYIFPWVINKSVLVKGNLTIYPPMNELIFTKVKGIVWEDESGNDSGYALVPIHKSCNNLKLNHRKAYQVLCLLDAVRSWLPRERKIAIEKLTEIIK